MIAYGKYNENELLKIAASVENDSEHPLAEAIVNKAKKNIEIKPYEKFRAMPGYGIRAIFEGKEVQIGNRKLMENRKINVEISQKIMIFCRMKEKRQCTFRLITNWRDLLQLQTLSRKQARKL